MDELELLNTPTRVYAIRRTEGINTVYEVRNIGILGDFATIEQLDDSLILAIPPKTDIEAGYFVIRQGSKSDEVYGIYVPTKDYAEKIIKEMLTKNYEPKAFKAFKNDGTGTPGLLKVFENKRNRDLDKRVEDILNDSRF